MTPSHQTLYLAPIVHAPTRAHLEIYDALICIRSGRVAWIERLPSLSQQAADTAAARRGTDLDNLVVVHEGFLCPGMVDTHTHAPQYPNNGLGHSLQLLEWLDALTFPLERKFSDDDYARQVYGEVVRRTLAAGTTTACYYSTLHVPASLTLAEVALEAGQRALVGRCSMDRNSPPDYVEESCVASMTSTHEFLDAFPHFFANTPSILSNGSAYANQPLVRPILTPRFALSCSPPLLSALGKLAKENDLPIQTHISENHAEIEAVRKAFPDLPSYAGVYDHFGLLTPRTILAHGVHLTPDEVSLIAERGAGVSHCPTSNVNLNSGAARVLGLLDAGVRVGLGSDCSGGPATGVLAAIRSADAMSRILAFEGLTARGLSIAELWFLATRGGADIAGVDAGSFEPGREFDALWIRPRSPGFWGGGDTRALFEKWLFAGDDRDIGAVWVRGRCVSGSPP
ncbi:hypothetical protein CcaverHIS002_0700760 [Cutaneotrichosporon cavernicola]|uniref:Probable guanine deaminase n=1 Tax=Cutaneotrichosporon cavernicola TaxID=279322 RepID=A0AA48L9Q8_9TREE|nr:uncharacterized protein CcaverHIS019_0700770 [Cutaneotrichosporon cavernicola]BEI86730.1 hypothetical protein CcaverHIS002_0700760 [Cutaneotrichosporon cavernicola]BEI94505.1 hypothetical protein CcaverHIS019_0700770 [Cutaneotrichosporon cavernicola]BEJ02281.1 hypothetical protein CcaverHIS631_0700760 [Cutaneotrichosporon cavernicola]BEJ10040.1 hypothetical protein CcaverHIS641_0700750 [Cutaneotrichosporon cavernicola]